LTYILIDPHSISIQSPFDLSLISSLVAPAIGDIAYITRVLLITITPSDTPNPTIEASTAIRDHVLNPTAVYSQIESWDRVLGDNASTSTSWDESFQNPKNRIDSLTPSQNLSWHLDGVDPEGVRFFAYPTFALGKPPLRIDVYIPGQQDHQPQPRRVLRSTSAPFIHGSRIAGLEIC
jgi:hypothetical protein